MYNWVKDIFLTLGKVTIKDTGVTVVLTSSSANRETQKHRSTREENKAVFQEFKDVVENSIKIDDRNPDERHQHAQEIYFNKIQIEDDTFEVEIVLDYLAKNKEYRYAGHKVNKIAPSFTQT